MNTAHLEEALQYHFHNPALLRLALTHPSCGAENNQRLEFLGDAVLQLAMSDIVFAAHPEQEEGGMTFLRARMVREETLCAVARHLQLGRYLRMDHGCEITGGRERPAVLADAMEAVLAAVYVDGGYEAARGVIRVLFQEEERLTARRGQDDKSALQEYTQANGLDLPAYEIVAQSGPDHDRRFTAQVSVQGRAVATGEGNSKKAAEQAAAKAALKACRGEA